MRLDEFKEIVKKFTEEEMDNKNIHPEFKNLLAGFNDELQKWNE